METIMLLQVDVKLMVVAAAVVVSLLLEEVEWVEVDMVDGPEAFLETLEQLTLEVVAEVALIYVLLLELEQLVVQGS